jgi:hypothetical protein
VALPGAKVALLGAKVALPGAKVALPARKKPGSADSGTLKAREGLRSRLPGIATTLR